MSGLCGHTLIDSDGYRFECRRSVHGDDTPHADMFWFSGKSGADRTPRYGLMQWSADPDVIDAAFDRLGLPAPAAPEGLTMERVAAAIDHHDHAIGWDRMCSGEACAAKLLEALR
jgi:hypothetical protein